jgi:NACHT domain- and WD repeat-containing protein
VAQTGQAFRIFVSSTFSDMKAERDALQSRTFPKLRELCERNGARFQAIDLRWGVSNEAGLDQKAVPICMAEIERCRAVTKRPNFMVLMGDRYGWQPPPYTIPAEEFEQVVQHIRGKDKETLETWYHRDNNAVPPEYVLQSREGEYTENEVWWPIESELLAMLRNAVTQANLTPEQRYKYETAVTEQEITEGIFNAHNAADTGVCFFRRIEGLPDDNKTYAESETDGRNKLDSLRQRLRDHLPAKNIYDYQARWLGDKISHDHIDQLCDDVYDSLARIILEEIKAYETIGEMEAENQNHEDFCAERSQHFIGREDILSAIQTYLGDDGDTLLAIHGQSGVGKSAFMAKAIQQSLDSHTSSEIIYRFIGVTPQSSDSRTLLGNLCRELAVRYDQDAGTIPIDYNELAKKFRECLEFVTLDRPLILFLDALDQLTDAGGRWLNWLPADLPENVRLIVSTLPGECLDALERKLPEENRLEMTQLDADDGETLLVSWLKEAGRVLQPNQHQEVISKFNACGLPLYLKLAFEEARLWHSYDPPTKFADDIPGIIGNLFVRLDDETNHGELLVSRSLGYIAVARNGLSETEILDVLAWDKEYFSHIQAISAKYGHKLPEERIPISLWSRLYLDLAPYLTERGTDGTALLGFYHRQFSEAVTREYLTANIKTERHAHLAQYFNMQSMQAAQGTPNQRKISELPYQQSHGNLSDEFVQTLTDVNFMQSKLEGAGVNFLIEDYDLASLLELEKEEAHAIKLMQSVLSMSAHVLGRDTKQLAAQLAGRLSGHQIENSAINDLLGQVKTWEGGVWLQPLTAFLEQPGGPLIRTLEGHTGWVTSLAISPDGKYIASGDTDGKLIVFDFETGLQLYQVDLPDATFEDLAITSDGHHIVAFSITDTGKAPSVWSLEGGRKLYVMDCPDHDESIGAIALTKDGNLALSGSGDYSLKVWDMEQKALSFILTGHKDLIERIAVTPDSRYAISASYDSTLKIWDLSKRIEVSTLEGHTDLVRSVVVTPDGSQIISGSDDTTIKMWGFESMSERHTLSGHDWHVISLALTPDGKKLVSGSGDTTVKVWDTETRQELATFLGHQDWINAVVVTPDGRHTVSASSDFTLKIWDIENLPQSSDSDNYGNGIRALTIMPDQQWIITGSVDHLLKVWSLKTGEMLFSLSGHTADVKNIAVSQNHRLLVSGSEDNSIKVWDLEQKKVIHTLTNHTDTVTALLMTPDQQHFISASADHTIKIWDIHKGTLLRTLHGHTDSVLTLAITPDGKRVMSGASDNTLKIWDFKTGNESCSLLHPEGSVKVLAVTPNGRFIVSGLQINEDSPYTDAKQMLRIWDAESMSEVRSIVSHEIGITALAITSNSKYMISTSIDMSIKLWDLINGDLLATFDGEHVIWSCAIAPDDMTVIIGDNMGRPRFLAMRGIQ